MSVAASSASVLSPVVFRPGGTSRVVPLAEAISLAVEGDVGDLAASTPTLEAAVVAAYKSHRFRGQRAMQHFRIGPATYLGILRRAGLNIAITVPNPPRFRGAEAEEMIALWHEGASMRSLARRYGCCEDSISTALTRAGYPPRCEARKRRATGPLVPPRVPRSLPKIRGVEADDLVRRWLAGASIAALAERFNCSRAAVSTALANGGYPPRCDERRRRSSRGGRR